MRRRALLLSLALWGCKRDGGDDGTAPRARALPPLVLRDDTPDLLLTYLDERGDYHTTQKPADVPEPHRKAVRVVVTTRDEGSTTDLLYLADLSQRRPDGTYPVASITRAQWEAAAEQKRAGRPVAVASAQPTAAPTAPQPAPAGGARVIIYGASWCGPCHDAQAFLKARGVPFVYHDIDVEDDARREMSAKLDRARQRKGTIPVIDVGGRIMVGFDPGAMLAALKAAQGNSAAL